MPNNNTKDNLPVETSFSYIEEIPVTEIPDYLQGVLVGGRISGSKIIPTITISATGYIKGGQTAYNTGKGFFLGYSTDAYKFSIGNPASDYFLYDGTSIKLYSNTADGFTLDYGSNILLKEGGSIKFTSVPAPTACTATLITTDTGNVDAGTHTYKVTYVTATGETELGAASNTVTTDANNKQVALSAIPVNSSGAVTKRKIYRTKAGGATYFLLTTINNNTETTYTDNTADAGLTGGIANSRVNTTFGKIIIDDIVCINLGSSNVFLGQGSGDSSSTGYYNTAVGLRSLYKNTTGRANAAMGYNALYYNTTGIVNSAMGAEALFSNTIGAYNSAVGYDSLYVNTTGNYNSAMGYLSLYSNDNGNYNTALGSYALYSNSSGSNNVAIGWEAGEYETGSNAFYVNNQDRTNTAGDKAKSLIYGIMAANPADQKLTINALFNQSVSKTPAAANAAGTAGDICWDASYIYVAVDTDTWKRVAIATW